MSVIKYKVSTSKRIGILFLDRLAFPVYSCIFFPTNKIPIIASRKVFKSHNEEEGADEEALEEGQEDLAGQERQSQTTQAG